MKTIFKTLLKYADIVPTKRGEHLTALIQSILVNFICGKGNTVETRIGTAGNHHHKLALKVIIYNGAMFMIGICDVIMELSPYM